MVPAGMPELRLAQDVEYLKEHLWMQHSDEEAETQFKREIVNSLGTASRQLDNMIHMMKHF